MLIPLQNGDRDKLSQRNCYLLIITSLGIFNAFNVFQLQATRCKENNLQFFLDTNVFILRKSTNEDINLTRKVEKVTLRI